MQFLGLSKSLIMHFSGEVKRMIEYGRDMILQGNTAARGYVREVVMEYENQSRREPSSSKLISHAHTYTYISAFRKEGDSVLR